MEPVELEAQVYSPTASVRRNALGAFRAGRHGVRVRCGDHLEIDGTTIPDELVEGAYIFIPDFLAAQLTLGARGLGEFGLRLETKTRAYTLCVTRSFLDRGASHLSR